MKITRFRVCVIIFWAVMTGWLIRYEAFPQWFPGTVTTYRALFEKGPLILDSWMQITFEDMPIGYTHTWVDSHVESQTESYTVRNQTILNLKLMGEEKRINVSAGATLDAQYHLESFFTVLLSDSYSTRIDGQKIDAGLFKVRVQTPSGEREVSLSVPEDVMIYSPITEMAIQQLTPGQSLRLRVLDPVSMTVSEVTAQALRNEILHHAGRDEETTVLRLTYQGLETLSWVDRKGRVLQQKTPFGWTMKTCSADEILTSKQHITKTVDMLSAMAVPCRGKVANPRSCRKLTLQLNGFSLDPEALASHRQIIEPRQSAPIQLTILAQPEPKQICTLGVAVPAECRPYLAPSLSVQSDHPDIIQQAKTIIGSRTDSFEAANAIFHWVYDNIEKRPTVSLPSALDVLRKKEGDCNEHTYLFVALARAAGLPARINVGLVYGGVEGYENAFYYHAWPSVYVGEWVEMDPTLGQTVVDATHISLVKGELASQMKLLGLLGQVSVDILAEKSML